MELQLRRFLEKDFVEYQHWFKDETMNKALGPMDDDWLRYVMEDENGIQIAIHSQETLISVIGIVPPEKEGGPFVISGFAVNPVVQNLGYGTASLHLLLKEFALQHVSQWICYVASENDVARHFFQKNGWRPGVAENGMIPFYFKANVNVAQLDS
ncbi:MAG: GNAT family N-acetyltransferase [Saprospiraceae bacterium]|nr:GNAT family N-acetyltransferase [Saprospiraceae bacterium]